MVTIWLCTVHREISNDNMKIYDTLYPLGKEIIFFSGLGIQRYYVKEYITYANYH